MTDQTHGTTRPVPEVLQLDLSDLTYLDSTGARSLELLARKILRRGGQMELRAVTPAQRHSLEKAGLTPPLVRYVDAPTPDPG